MDAADHDRPILVTGSTGYIGGLLTARLLELGRPVRVVVRDPTKLRRVPWGDRVEVATGDATDPDTLGAALAGVRVAYFLLHSMDGRGDFVARDRLLAHAFAEAAHAAGVRRIVYLSGLHPAGPLSPHLGSRVEVGGILLGSGVPTVVLQAGVVLGAGSASFDMLRHLTERLPAMFGPKWLNNRTQPIAIDDVLHYLVAAADAPGDLNRTFDIGGPEVLSYRDMIKRYARVAGLGNRPVGVVPVLTPALASHWVGLVTPVAAGIARPLVGSLVHEAVSSENDAPEVLGAPPGGPTGFDEAIRRATRGIDPTRWRRTVRTVGVATLACAGVGSLLTNPASDWYRELRMPAWQPPPVAFPVVWTTLFAGIALAATTTISELAEVGRQEESDAVRAAYLANLVVNGAWSGVFFRAHRPDAATWVAGLLALSAADLARRAVPAGPGKVLGFGAYAAWSTFATGLSWAVARRNPRADGS